MYIMNQKVPEVEATLKTADELWSAFKKKQEDAVWAKKDTQDKIGYFQQVGFSDFITKYAVPTRYMVMYGEYSHNAFQKYLTRLKTVGYHSKSDWIDRQADYVKMLWRAYNPRGATREAAAAWQGARDSISKEMEGFETDYERAKAKAEDRRKAASESQREILREMSRVNMYSVAEIRSSITGAPVAPVATAEVAVAPVAPVEVAPVEAAKLTESQRRNAARRRRVKIANAITAVPAVDLAKLERKEYSARRESIRDERRKQKAVETILSREAEKDRMRARWESTREVKPAATAPDAPVADSDLVADLPDE